MTIAFSPCRLKTLDLKTHRRQSNESFTYFGHFYTAGHRDDFRANVIAEHLPDRANWTNREHLFVQSGGPVRQRIDQFDPIELDPFRNSGNLGGSVRPEFHYYG